MSRVRLELTVPDHEADEVAEALIRGYHGMVAGAASVIAHVTVEIRSGEDAQQERAACQQSRR